MGATDAKTNFGQLVDTALSEPVAIERSGREVTVMISRSEFDRLKSIEIEALERKALVDFVAGRASKTETMQFLGLTSIYELRMKMSDFGIVPPHLPRERVDELLSKAATVLFKPRKRTRS